LETRRTDVAAIATDYTVTIKFASTRIAKSPHIKRQTRKAYDAGRLKELYNVFIKGGGRVGSFHYQWQKPLVALPYKVKIVFQIKS
jgi:hypothetical protein